MVSSKGISRQPSANPSLNFNALREEGLSTVRALSGKIWTDHNLHDPGVTTLEVLCYALTDAGYRTEILKGIFESDKTPSPEFIQEYFFKKADLLPESPVTAEDFEKKIEQHPQVVSAWLTQKPTLKFGYAIRGFYEVVLMLRPDTKLGDLNTDGLKITLNSGNTGMDIAFFTRNNQRMDWRDVGEIVSCKMEKDRDDSFFIYEQYNFQILLLLEVKSASDPVADSTLLSIKARGSVYSENLQDRLLEVTGYQQEIIKHLESKEFIQDLDRLLIRERYKQQLASDIRHALLPFRNLCEDFTSFSIVNTQEIKIGLEVVLLNDVINPDSVIKEIFYQLDAFLFRILQQAKKEEAPHRKNILYASNMIEEILKVKGVEAAKITNLNLYIDGVPTRPLDNDNSFENLELYPFTNFVPRISREKSSVHLIHFGEMAVTESIAEDEMHYQLMPETIDPRPENENAETDFSLSNEMLLLDELAEYISIQKDFPENYRLDEGRLTGQIRHPLQAKIRQFKGYLFFFERILISYLNQLSNFNKLFSPGYQTMELENEMEYLQKILPELEQLELIDLEKLDGFAESHGGKSSRNERITDHLLARFATQGQFVRRAGRGAYNQDERYEKQRLLLQDIPVITRDRGVGQPFPEYPQGIWNNDLLSGFQKRVYRLIGIDNPTLEHKKLSEEKGDDPAGFYLVEHILLVEKDGLGPLIKKFNKSASALLDFLKGLDGNAMLAEPFSFQLTLILPAWYPVWLERKEFIRNLIEEQLPAHIMPSVHWLNEDEMRSFEGVYENWLDSLLKLN
jgi:hypothetical protein